MRPALAVLAAAAAVGGGAAAAAPGAFVPTVGCDEIAGHLADPPVADGGRIVLGTVAVPARDVGTTVRAPGSPVFRYWVKVGLFIRAGRMPVQVSVPERWRDRVRIEWGSRATAARTVRFSPCPSAIATWDAYAGGFLLRTRSACLPLVFTVGRRRGTLTFDVGGGC